MPWVTGKACVRGDDRWVGSGFKGSRIAGQRIARGLKRSRRKGRQRCPSLIFPRLHTRRPGEGMERQKLSFALHPLPQPFVGKPQDIPQKFICLYCLEPMIACDSYRRDSP
ncbi:hypothetical protein [Azospirillum argentinense]